MLRFREFINVPPNGQYDINFFNSFQSDETIILSFQDTVSGYTSYPLDTEYRNYIIFLGDNVLATDSASYFNELYVASYVKLSLILPTGFVSNEYVSLIATTSEQIYLKVSASTVKGFIEPCAYLSFSGKFQNAGMVELLRMAYYPHAIINGQIDVFEGIGNTNELSIYRYARDGYLDGMYSVISTSNNETLKVNNLYIGSGFSLRFSASNNTARYNGYFKINLL